MKEIEKHISWVFILMPCVFQKPIGGTNRSTRRGVVKVGRLFVFSPVTLAEGERIRAGSSLTLQINAPFNPRTIHSIQRLMNIARYLQYGEHVLVLQYFEWRTYWQIIFQIVHSHETSCQTTTCWTKWRVSMRKLWLNSQTINEVSMKRQRFDQIARKDTLFIYFSSTNIFCLLFQTTSKNIFNRELIVRFANSNSFSWWKRKQKELWIYGIIVTEELNDAENQFESDNKALSIRDLKMNAIDDQKTCHREQISRSSSLACFCSFQWTTSSSRRKSNCLHLMQSRFVQFFPLALSPSFSFVRLFSIFLVQ